MISVSVPTSLRAQDSNAQLWFEYMLNYSFAQSFNFESAFTYSTLLNTPRWRAIDYAPTLDYSITPNIDLSIGGTLSYTAQTESYNTFEVRPMVGSRIHITPNKRVMLRVYVRLEQRNFKNLETKEWDHTFRPRLRAESIVPINRKSYYDDKLWYGVADVEWLYAIEDVEERFANRFRVRVGIGYRIDYARRFEFLYMNQQSRNGIDDEFYSSDNIFRFRFRQYIRHKKPAVPD